MLKMTMRTFILALVLTAALALAGCGQTSVGTQTAGKVPVLFAYVGAQLKGPVSQLAQMYQQKTGVAVQLTFNNSGALLSQLETSRRGDIFIPGSMAFVQKAQSDGDVSEVTGPLAYHVPVIVTPKGNPAGIKGVRDLAKPGVKLLMPDAQATAIGMDALAVFKKLGITGAVAKNTVASFATPSAALAAMLMGRGNAAVVSQSAIAQNQGKVDVVEIDPKVNVIGQVPCAVLSFSGDQSRARDFAAFLASNGPKVFTAFGFQSTP